MTTEEELLRVPEDMRLMQLQVDDLEQRVIELEKGRERNESTDDNT